jgi:ABC-type multidrug transport system ATPase subunit
MADRIGIIAKGELSVVEEKAELMRKLGKKQLTLDLLSRIDAVPGSLAGHRLTLSGDGRQLVYTYDTQAERTGITALLKDLSEAGIRFRDLHTTRPRSRTSSSTCEARPMNHRALGHLLLRNGAHGRTLLQSTSRR